MSNQGSLELVRLGLAISEKTYLITNGTFFAIAVTVAIARIIIRFRKWRRIFVEDYFFFVALASLIASSGLWFRAVPRYFFMFSLPENTIFVDPKLLHRTLVLTIEGYVAEGFTWITIFSVKFSFLFYFRSLISKVHGINILWWCTLAILIPVACVSPLIGAPISCPYTGEAIIAHCVSDQAFFLRERRMVYFSVISDILTDALLISIPILLLTKTHFKVRQKLGVGIVLCLSIVMIAIGIVRGVIARVHGVADETSATFWTQLESCISIIMACVPAFRTLFTTSNKPQKLSPSPPRYGTERFLRFGKKSNKPLLPDVEVGATMTGMRTMIRNQGKMETGSDMQSLPSSTRMSQSSDATRVFDGEQHLKQSHSSLV